MFLLQHLFVLQWQKKGGQAAHDTIIIFRRKKTAGGGGVISGGRDCYASSSDSTSWENKAALRDGIPPAAPLSKA